MELPPISDTVEEWGAEKIKEILKSNNIHGSVSEVIIKDSGLKGENLASTTSCATITFEDPQLSALHLFVKRLPESETHSVMVTDSKLFLKEAIFFMEYLPEVENFCRKIGHESLLEIYPKCYYGDDKLVVLENLILTKGYSLFKKEDMQGFDVAVLALTNLAKHHAISYAYIKEIGGSQEFLKRYADLNFLGVDTDGIKAILLPFIEDPLGYSIDILSKSNQENRDKAIDVLKGYQGKAYEKYLEPLKRKFDKDDNRILVLNHGDFWSSNMMFLKDKLDETKYTGNVMIDFQLVNFSTPGVDLGYYLFTSVKPSVRQNRLKELLEIYLEVFRKTTADLGYPVETTYDDLLRDFRETFVQGFLVGLSLCTGIAYAVIGDADPTDVDMDEFATVYNKLVEKWIADNPEKNEEMAKMLVSVVEEHQKLILT